jgi:hypothetical protein
LSSRHAIDACERRPARIIRVVLDNGIAALDAGVVQLDAVRRADAEQPRRAGRKRHAADASRARRSPARRDR